MHFFFFPSPPDPLSLRGYRLQDCGRRLAGPLWPIRQSVYYIEIYLRYPTGPGFCNQKITPFPSTTGMKPDRVKWFHTKNNERCIHQREKSYPHFWERHESILFFIVGSVDGSGGCTVQKNLQRWIFGWACVERCCAPSKLGSSNKVEYTPWFEIVTNSQDVRKERVVKNV